MYQVIDRKTGKVVGKYKNLRTAVNAVNRLDNQYGGCRYHHKRIDINQAV